MDLVETETATRKWAVGPIVLEDLDHDLGQTTLKIIV